MFYPSRALIVIAAMAILTAHAVAQPADNTPLSAPVPTLTVQETPLADKGPQRNLFRAAQEAYEQSIADFRTGKITDPEVVYRWSKRWMKAEETLEDKAAPAAKQHLRRMAELAELVEGSTAENTYNLAVKYYRTEAESLATKAEAEKVASSSHDAAIEVAEEYLRAVLHGNTEAAEKLAVRGSLAASKRLMAGFKGFASGESFRIRAIQGVGPQTSVGQQTSVLIEEVPPAETTSNGRARGQFNVALIHKDGRWLVTNFSAHKSAPRQNDTAAGASSRPVVGMTTARPRNADPNTDPFGAPPAAGPKETKVIILKHSKANDLAETISRLRGTEGPLGVAMAVDERTNRVILRGAADQVAEVIELIVQLDVPGPARATDAGGGSDSTLRALQPAKDNATQ